MSRSGAILQEHDALISAALIAAEATHPGSGFRQRDVRFFIELFSNWMQSTTGSWALTVHNAQIARHLAVAVAARWVAPVTRKPPTYRLTPEGLLELLRRLSQRSELRRLDEFLLVFHFLDTYGPELRALVEKSGPLASRALAVDVKRLTDPSRLLERERALVQRSAEQLRVRAEESLALSELAQGLLRSGASVDDTALAVERRFPYELNSQRPLRELLAGLPTSWSRQELTSNARRRALRFWAPTRELLLAYDAILAHLAATRCADDAPAR